MGADDADRVIIEALEDHLEGRVLRPGTSGYEEVRRVWNTRIDRHPLAIVQPSTVEEIQTIVEIAGEFDRQVTAKGGGHHVGGSAVVDGAIMVDMAELNDVSIDLDERTVTVGGGATWGEVDAVTQQHGLAAVGGQDPNIGVAGLTLGGGVGWLSRAFGLAADNLIEAEVVTADGRVVVANESTNEDLFWGLRGAGGALGIVTSFTFRLHPVDEVLAESLVYPIERAKAVLEQYRDLSERAPDTLRPLFGLFELPESSPLAAKVDGDRVAIIIVCCIPPFEDAIEAMGPIREQTSPLVDSIKRREYLTFQGAGESEPHARTSLRSQYVDTLDAEVIDRIVACGTEVPSPGATVFVSPRGGAEVRPAGSDTAYPHRHPCHHVLIEARWDDVSDDEVHERWVTTCERELAPFTTSEKSINFIDVDEPAEAGRAAFGSNAERLTAIKQRWDPTDRFGGHARSQWEG